MKVPKMIVSFPRCIVGKIDESNILHIFLKDMFFTQICLPRKRILTIIIQEVQFHIARLKDCEV
jgi:hypothetical protein